MRSVLNGFLTAVSAYSPLPVPGEKKSRETMPYILCFLPVIGAVIGFIMGIYALYCIDHGVSPAGFALAGAALPVLLSRGAHLSGFMKTWDALASDKKQPAGRIERLEDDRAGVSSVIAAIVYFLLYAGGLTLLRKEEQLFFLGTGYMISRTLFGMAFVWFPCVGKDRMLMAELPGAQKQNVRITLSVILALCFCTCIAIAPIMGVLMALLCMWIWTYYFYMSKKRFGGITEETAGYFLTLCELAVVLFIAVFAKTGM